MRTLGYYNGEVGALEKMRVPMLDRAFYFGDGVYDVMYSKNHIVYAMDEHIDRFFDGAEHLHLVLTKSKDEIKTLLKGLVEQVDDGEQLIYIQASRGTGVRQHAYDGASEANLCVMLRPARIRDTYEKVSAVTRPDERHGYCRFKTLNLLPNILYAKEAEAQGAYEAILYRDGRVTECAHSNVSILRNGTLFTAPADGYILAGTARAHLLSACRRLGVPAREEPFSPEEMRRADEILISSSSAFCLGVSKLDGVPAGGGDGELLKVLQDALMEEFLLSTAL